MTDTKLNAYEQGLVDGARLAWLLRLGRREQDLFKNAAARELLGLLQSRAEGRLSAIAPWPDVIWDIDDPEVGYESAESLFEDAIHDMENVEWPCKWRTEWPETGYLSAYGGWITSPFHCVPALVTCQGDPEIELHHFWTVEQAESFAKHLIVNALTRLGLPGLLGWAA